MTSQQERLYNYDMFCCFLYVCNSILLQYVLSNDYCKQEPAEKQFLTESG